MTLCWRPPGRVLREESFLHTERERERVVAALLVVNVEGFGAS